MPKATAQPIAGLSGEPQRHFDLLASHPDQPLYVPGPEDDLRAVLARLDAAVGSDNSDVFADIDDVALLDTLDDALAADAFDEDDDAFDNDGVLTVEGSEVSAEARR
jgi:hypothetical protein